MENFMSDELLGTFAPILVYWVYSGIYVLLSPFENYRLHPKKDEHVKNLVSKRTVVRGVLLQQALQAAVAVILFSIILLCFEWPIFERWDVPWEGQTVVLTMIACGISFVLTGFVEASVTSYLGIQIVNLGADEKAELLFVDQFIVTAVVLGVIYGLTKSFQPLPDDIFCYNWKEPFNLQKGWLLWAVLGIVVAFLAIALTGAALALFNGETPEREKDALIILLPLIGSSSISTAYLVGITGVLAPVLEETLFRGFLMVTLTKWLPTSVSVIISAAAFALAHLTPGEFPQLFVLGTALGFTYAHTRNLLTPITIHALWNSGVILILTFLQLQGYYISNLLQGS
ncbi:CAAX amino terminal protease family protein isoform 1 [Cinnamomum micranthum f. kanehirae]|uniref:CAAX amino terminal protease family protein isoform 1 n=1 Tax=Cinnamomum micranthum f. kanehirae TaxID=337451 RepID=A0A443PJL1_9MAGN|nr:CAAX amino terminal protease family protein isoform 1 [Cinnamomum micranthum f. kanehirae]